MYIFSDICAVKSEISPAELGPEELTTNYADPRPFTERHPSVLWLALAIAVILLAYAATRSLSAAKARFCGRASDRRYSGTAYAKAEKALPQARGVGHFKCVSNVKQATISS